MAGKRKSRRDLGASVSCLPAGSRLGIRDLTVSCVRRIGPSRRRRTLIAG